MTNVDYKFLAHENTNVNYMFLDYFSQNSACKANETSVEYMFLEFDEE